MATREVPTLPGPLAPAEGVIHLGEVVRMPLDREQAWGYFVDSPRSGDELDTFGVTVDGWVLGRRAAARAVELLHGEQVLARADVNVRRPDIARAFPHVGGAERSGFRLAAGLLTADGTFELLVRAELEDGTVVPVATIAGAREPLRTGFRPKVQPLLVTTLGRTGSTWLMQLLEQHPAVVAYRPFMYEPRLLSYWLEVIRELSEPASYLQSLRADLSGEHWWLGDRRPSALPPLSADPPIRRWLGDTAVRSLAAFSQARIEEFYLEVARVQGRELPRYYAEKCWPDHFAPVMMWELFPDAREVLLVRDFRDIVCSVLAFNRKLGYRAFGRELVETDGEFARQLRESAVRMLDSWRARADRSLLLRYEDLITRPGETLSGLFSYLGIDARAGTVDDVVRAATAAQPDVQLAHQTSADARSSIGRWRRDLDEELQAECETAFGDVLEAFGYER